MIELGVGGAVDWRLRSDQRVWPAEAQQLSAMRAEVHGWLAPLGLPEDVEHDLVLAVSEAASNAVEHAYPPDGPTGRVELAFWLAGGRLHIAVTDYGTWRPPPPGPRGRGFGLPMMRGLVETVTVEHDARGTRVVLEHPLPGPAAHLAPVSDDGAERR